ncbi:cation:proton antiporter [Fastidiosipila sanguinis]|uniref:Potassium transporter n=1 Tax=Fastidiosipila sanguinis TaxID=236753 RepID=A0A2S0KM51_9FIRM|nr:cation:proton antiporter [Fastidiosipila sanguinis]AVM42110.1 potassium transporter [Fastidiosipila sanguinis]
MLTSLSLILLLGFASGFLFEKIKIPKIIGMLFAGIILGPYVLDWFDPKILSISAELRKIALIIILLKAGFSLDLNDLKKVGRPAVLMSFVPASFEIIAYVIFAPWLLGISRIDAAVMGAVLSAVSPAVVVPRMVNYIETNWGSKKSIPQMIMASASCDDIIVIVLFTTFLGIAQEGTVDLKGFLNIPISIIMGILLGISAGFILHYIFEKAYLNNQYLRNSVKVIIILAVSLLMVTVEDMLKGILSVSGLLAVVSMACVLKIKSNTNVSERLSEKFGKIWIAAEIILFVLVGAAVDIRYTLEAGSSAVLLILLALIVRSFGVWLSILKTNLSWKEKLFCVIAYLPKATVQAAIGSVPLAVGLPSGNLILSVAVMSILITAPIGAAAMDNSYKVLLKNE